MKAIETVYHGYKFRSRLEARWAVFFDKLGVEYEYEPEGYEYGCNDNDSSTYRWLPDFRLPNENNLLVEVKGSDGQLRSDWRKLAMAVADHNTPASNGLLILGDIPDPDFVSFGSIPLFSYLEWHDGINCDFAAFFDSRNESGRYLVRGAKKVFMQLYEEDTESLAPNWTNTYNVMPNSVSTDCCIQSLNNLRSYNLTKLKFAYTEARQARFEHGETP